MIVIAIVSNPDKLSGKLTKFFTGSYAYHIGFVDTEAKKFYDMNLLFRRRNWPHYPDANVAYYECPVPVARETLEFFLDTDEDWYGIWDYMWFLIKKLFYVKTSPSFKGAICSEKVNQILISCGWEDKFYGAVPSPADFERVLKQPTM